MSASDPRETRPAGPSMSALLASCAAARSVSTPPPAPQRRTPAIPEPAREDDRGHGHRDAA
ncbi:hypothetical protein QIS99_05750 [Streptomyces sp. B-S-A8]|uniref:Uncharacterized protein n=1 Tax=Streptomyces solicavernae TaxID=3043614 RepID=A0ABT6RMS5_9ACTN|nr:hypothetical protein [Streptomyces sp. B-S-A8]MDI3385723.1 hypothetical protein [Streptomyces sp. B-S-A8]